MRHKEKKNVISVPIHVGKEIGTGMLKKVLKEAGIRDFRKR